MNVIWSPQAKKDYWLKIDYLEAEWTFQDVVNFIDKVDYTITLLDKNNIEFISTNYKEVNKSGDYKTNYSLLQNKFQYN
ncbi:hypothetical protein GCM10011508_19860 [Flavobacterium lutivivi]|nr:hypothetical protein GCM10011508_19860 [Flavobacterium lutivivi]